MNKKLLTFTALPALAVLAYFIFLVNPTSSTDPKALQVGISSEVLSENDSIDSNVQTIALEAGSFYYSQPEIKVKIGDTVKITMTAKDMMHDFRIDEFKVNSGIVKAGEMVKFEFIVDKSGTFEYYCSVGQHRQNGQVGKLIVE